MRRKDLVGQKIGHLLVLGIAGYKEYAKDKRIIYHVKCDCGNEKDVVDTLLMRKNHIQSCGCMTSSILRSRYTDIAGERFGRLTVVEPCRLTGDIFGWKCVCDCGNVVSTTTTKLKSGHTRSCGCLQIDRARKDISGQKFGMLTAVDMAYSDKDTVYWNCVCDCGNTYIASGSSLRYGSTTSCGCMRSSGENAIKEFLDMHHITYYREKKFNKCKDVGLLKFDFWLPDYGLCIEFDGIQHYQDAPRWDKKSSFDDRKRRDEIKTKYCEENDIILLRVPYWEKDNIESILSDWLFLNDGEEANSSTIDLSA